MLSLINITIFFLWLASAGFGVAHWAYLAQLKEYRFDKLRDYFSTLQGKQAIFSKQMLARACAATVFFFAPFNDIAAIKQGLIIFFTIDILFHLYQFSKKRLRFPVRTKKAFLVLGASLCLEGIFFLVLSQWWLPWGCFVLFSFLSVALLLWWPTHYSKRHVIKRATKKMALHRANLTVIGVTGSYGKTTVKEFLSHILGSQFRVMCTPKHVNTDIGVAQFILKTHVDSADICIVEMGAYGMGEISAICDIVNPDIGILTAISPQHLSLFGTIENIQKTKFELLRSLPKNGLAITNSDNPYCREPLSTLTCAVQTFGLEEVQAPTLHILRADKQEDGFSCSYAVGDETVSLVAARVMGTHNAINLAPCFLVARYLGMSPDQFRTSLTTLEQPARSLEALAYGKAIILDDSYNANPDGFLAALDALSYFPAEKRCIVITRGMLELGEKSKEMHEMIGKRIASFADELVIISTDEQEALATGVESGHSRTTVQTILDPQELLVYLEKKIEEDVILLLENRLPQDVYEKVRAKTHPYVKTS